MRLQLIEQGVVCTAQLAKVSDVSPLVARICGLFDLDADSLAVDRTLPSSPVLAVSVARVSGIRLPGSVEAEETLFRTLTGQQILVTGSRIIRARPARQIGTDGLFPTAAQLGESGANELGLPAAATT